MISGKTFEHLIRAFFITEMLLICSKDLDLLSSKPWVEELDLKFNYLGVLCIMEILGEVHRRCCIIHTNNDYY